MLIRTFLKLTTLGCAASFCLSAQNPSPAAEVKQAYNAVKNNMLKAADKISEADYSFKATNDVRNFGDLVAHVADSQLRLCSALNGAPKQSTPGKTAKADLVAALKDSYAECDKVYDSITDANALEGVSIGRGGPRTRVGALWGNVTHDNEMYGYMAVYMRLKGVVPPSSEGRGGR